MKNLNDFKVQELEGRLEMTCWYYNPCYNPCEPDPCEPNPCPEPEPEPECPTTDSNDTNSGGQDDAA